MTRLLIASLLAVPLAAAEKPNILLLCVDDLKPLIACYGDPIAKTPNIDRLATRGVRFDRAYCNQAVCSPSRNALLTGYRPQTLGIYDLATNFRKSKPDAVTLPQHFKNAGYSTEGMGKIFHVGHGNTNDAASWSVPFFQHKAVTYASTASQPTGEQPKNKQEIGSRGTATESADTPDNTYADGAVADEAVKRLTAKKGQSEPFFLAVGFIRPHLPFVAPKKYWDLYDPQTIELSKYRSAPEGAPSYAPSGWGELRRYRDIPAKGPVPDEMQRTLIHGYYAAISYMDAQVGRVLDALDASGHSTKTVVVLWGDHGWHLGDHGWWCKHTNYEQAARIPVIVAAPGASPGVSKAFIESVDIYPTLAELAGLAAPHADGTSFVKQLKSVKDAGKSHVIHVYPRGDRLGRAIRTDRYRMVEWKPFGAGPDKAEYELYDYESDPNETKNLAKDKPEVVKEIAVILTQYPEAKRPVK